VRIKPAIAFGVVATFLVLIGDRLISQVPPEPAAAHRYADSVLYPHFVAVANEWSRQHPQDAPGREGEHARRLDAGDIKRWGAVRAAWKDLDGAYRRAGY
jgi:hypothetical protein